MKITEYARKMIIVLFWIPIVLLAIAFFLSRFLYDQIPFIILAFFIVLLLLLIKPDIFKAFSDTIKTSIIAVSVSAIFFLFRDVPFYYIDWMPGFLNLFAIFEENGNITLLISVAILLALIKRPDIFKMLNDNLKICVATLLMSNIFFTFSYFLYGLSGNEIISLIPAFSIPPLCFIILKKAEIFESRKQTQHSGKCPKCDAKLPDNARFCDVCGEPLR